MKAHLPLCYIALVAVLLFLPNNSNGQAPLTPDLTEEFNAIWRDCSLLAVELYPAAADPKSTLSVRAVSMQKESITVGNTLPYDPISALRFIEYAANELGIHPSVTVNPDGRKNQLVIRDRQFCEKRDGLVKTSQTENDTTAFKAEIARLKAEVEQLKIENNNLETRLSNGTLAYQQLWTQMQTQIQPQANQARAFNPDLVDNPYYQQALHPKSQAESDREAAESVRQMNEFNASIQRDETNRQLEMLNRTLRR
jgi:regulator of replication initiation timing